MCLTGAQLVQVFCCQFADTYEREATERRRRTATCHGCLLFITPAPSSLFPDYRVIAITRRRPCCRRRRRRLRHRHRRRRRCYRCRRRRCRHRCRRRRHRRRRYHHSFASVTERYMHVFFA